MSQRITSVGGIPDHWAGVDPERTAIRAFDGDITYGVLARRARRVAAGFVAAGAAAGTRVVYFSKNDVRFFELLFGAAQAGMVLAPVNWRLSAEELAFVIADSEATIVVVSREFAPVVAAIRKSLPLVTVVLTLDADDDGDYDRWRDAQPDRAIGLRIAPDGDVLQLYTSGTTGLPKGAVLTDRNILCYVQEIARSPIAPVDRDTLMLVPLPQFHVAGACWALIALYHGGANLLPREASAPLIIEALRRFPVTKAGFVPAVMKMVLDDPTVADVDFARLDTIGYGGSPITPELMARAEAVFGCRLVQMFGMTESCALATFLSSDDIDAEHPERLTSVGRATPAVRIRVVGPEGDDVPPGESGEVLLAGENIMKGYWRRPEATAAAIVDGWYRSGDIGCFDADGFLYIRDRVKDMIISGGENVYSAEVERVLSAHPAIADVAVIGVPDDRWGEAVKAIVVATPDATLTAAAVIAHARTRLAGYKCPKSVDFVATLPRNASGKVLKRDLRAPYWADQPRAVS